MIKSKLFPLVTVWLDFSPLIIDAIAIFIITIENRIFLIMPNKIKRKKKVDKNKNEVETKNKNLSVIW